MNQENKFSKHHEALEKCEEIFGPEWVTKVLLVCALSDPQRALAFYEEMYMHDEAYMVRAIFFSED